MEIVGFHQKLISLEPSINMSSWSFCNVVPFCSSSKNPAFASDDDEEDRDLLQPSASVKVSSSVAKFLPIRRRLDLDPPNKLFFPYEPGKQVNSAIRIKNISKAHVAFKFQTTIPRSCYMTPPGWILAPGASLIATVFKFIEPVEQINGGRASGEGLKIKAKFKILSLKVTPDTVYIPELFDEQKDQVAVEQILRVVFLEPNRSCPEMEKLNRQLAEAEAELEARRKAAVAKPAALMLVGDGPVIDEWKLMRERYLAQKHQN